MKKHTQHKLHKKQKNTLPPYTVEILIGIGVFIVGYSVFSIFFTTPQNKDISALMANLHNAPQNDITLFLGNEEELDRLLGEDSENTNTDTDTLPASSETDTKGSNGSELVSASGYIETTSKTLPQNQKPLKNCTTPRGTSIKHNQQVMAYQPRSDEPSICRVQKRTCIDGELNGSYRYPQCPNVNDTTTQYEEVISYNEKKPNPYIQSNLLPETQREYTTDGQANTTDAQPTTIYDNTINDATVTEQQAVGQKIFVQRACTTPRGDKIPANTFVRAYRSPIGFSNMTCESEIRFCQNSYLHGSYKYKNCEYKDIPYETWLQGQEKNPHEPTPHDLIESLDVQGYVELDNRNDNRFDNLGIFGNLLNLLF